MASRGPAASHDARRRAARVRPARSAARAAGADPGPAARARSSSRSRAVSIGRLLDVAARAGRHPYPGFAFPHVLGAEHAGVIAAIGPGVTGWQVGQRVAAFPVVTDGTCHYCLLGYDELCENLQLIGIHRAGAYAQYVAVPARNLHVVPADISPRRRPVWRCPARWQ